MEKPKITLLITDGRICRTIQSRRSGNDTKRTKSVRGTRTKGIYINYQKSNSLIKKITEVGEIYAEKAAPSTTPQKKSPGAIDHRKRGWRVLY